uniref:Odorant-binding protein 16 n=1 Tax=Eocanthecona furcellata TaxID=696902 RepID=A0AAT9TZF0_9HEMI
MNSLLFLTTLLSAVCLSLAASDEYKLKVIQAVAACVKEHNANIVEVIQVIHAEKIPTNKAQKCVAGCFFNKMGYVTDSKVDWAKVKALNPKKYDTKELVAKADKVVDACSKVVNEKKTDVCELGMAPMKCLLEESKKIQLPKPEITFKV